MSRDRLKPDKKPAKCGETAIFAFFDLISAKSKCARNVSARTVSAFVGCDCDSPCPKMAGAIFHRTSKAAHIDRTVSVDPSVKPLNHDPRCVFVLRPFESRLERFALLAKTDRCFVGRHHFLTLPFFRFTPSASPSICRTMAESDTST